jgi:hypothetical protein
LGKNLELIIDKALNEKDSEKKDGFALAIAYYMKLAYSNWHKELVHDDAIRTELNAITGGGLEFSNTPYIKHRNPGFEREEYRSSNGSGRRQTFTSRSNRDMRGRDGRDSRDNRSSNRNNNGGNRDNRDNRGNNGNRGPNFKKRFK